MSDAMSSEQARALIRRIMNDDGYMVTGEANLLIRFIDQDDIEQSDHHAMMHGMHQREAKLRAACEAAQCDVAHLQQELSALDAQLSEALGGEMFPGDKP